MTVIARFEVIPVRDGSMSTTIASALRALDQHPVSYETTATDTIIEAETVEQVFAAIQAAHQAIPEDRVITSVEIDEDRRRPQTMTDRVASVERELGHPPQRRQQPPIEQSPPHTQTHTAGAPPQNQPSGRRAKSHQSSQPNQSQQSGQWNQTQQSGQSGQRRQSDQSMGPPEHPPSPNR